MSNINKQAVQAVADLKAGYTLGHADVAILNELARIALASLEAEPVGYMNRFTGRVFTLEEQPGADTDAQVYVPLYTASPAQANAEPLDWLWSHRKHPSEVTLVRPEDDEKAEGAHWSGWSCQALYAAPPAPVSDSLLSELLGIAKRAADEADEFAHAEFSNDSMEHSAAIADWERRAAMLHGAEPVTTAYKLQDGWVACSERMPEKGRILALFGKRIKEVCENYVDEGYIGSDGEYYFFDWESGPRIDDCHPYDKAIVSHWMYWELPAAPKREDL